MAMKKISIFAQWFILAALLIFMGYLQWRPTPQPDYFPETWNNWDGVTVLSYAGISRKESSEYPSVKRFSAQLSALRDAGYQTVRLEDVLAFLNQHTPLPEKALLLIFEGGRKEAFIHATPVLQRTGYRAVIAVPTSVMDRWGGFYLKRPDIARISRLPQWAIGSMGHQAIELLPNDGSGKPEHFLAQRIRNHGSEESANAFRDRITEDYAHSAQILKKITGHAPLLYLYPFAEAGQSPEADPLAEAANRNAVTQHFGLAFIGGSNPFNGFGSDPWTLSRLRVPGDWTPAQLLEKLASSQPRRKSLNAIGRDTDWVFDRQGEMQGSELRLSSGASAWLRGTDGWTDVDLHALLDLSVGGSAALYARYTSPRSWLRVTLGAEGLSVQEHFGERLQTLFRYPPANETQTLHQVQLRIRNNRAWVWEDNKPLAVNLPISPETSQGRVGLGSGQGHLQVKSFSARPLPARWIFADSIRQVPDAERDLVQALVPIWFRFTDPEPVVTQTAQQDLIQAAVTGIRTLPLLIGGDSLDATAAHAWAAAIDAELIRSDLKILVPTLAVAGPAWALAAELRNLDYRVAHILSPAQALEQGRAIALASPDEILIITGAGAEAVQASKDLLHVIPPSRLVLQESGPTNLAPDRVTARRLDSLTD